MQLLVDEATASSRPAVDGVNPLDEPLATSGTSGIAAGGSPLASATIKISHPNNSGMQFDQVSRNYIPAFFVQRIEADIDGRPLIDVETNFSLSENPVIALSFPAERAEGTLDVHALDSKGNRYEDSVPFAGGS